MKVFKLSIILTAFLAIPAWSQTAEEVLDKAAEAIGGKVAQEIDSMFMNASLVLPGGIKGKMEISAKGSDKIFVKTVINAPGMKIESVQGCDGTDCYSNDPNFGLRLLEGQEKEMLLTQNDFKIISGWRDFYVKHEYKGTGEVNGRKTHMVYLETKEGMGMTNHYDAETYLALKSDSTMEGPMGKMKVSSHFLEYKDVHKGFKLPMKTTITMMGQNMESTYDSMEVNLPIPDSRFQLPAGLK